MPLSFLVPAFLAGLAALAIPLVVHLTRRPKSRSVPFPSLMFLERIPVETRERRRIQHWLLLALRAGALALIVAAFARPFMASGTLAATGGAGPTERVVLLDRSWSMAGPGRWEAGVTAARDALAAPGPLDRVSLVVFDQGAAAVVRSASDPARPVQALDTLDPGARATRFGPGLKLAQTILDESELPAREVTVISDFQRNAWTGDEGVVFPEGTRVRTVDVGSGSPVGSTPGDNRAVARVTLTREQAGGRERIVPSARITRTGGSEPVQASVTLTLDGQEIQTSAVTLPPSGAVAVSFEPLTLAERHTRLAVSLDPDALPQDDAWHMVLSPGRATRVHLSAAPTRGTAGDLYLRRALEIGDDRGFAVAGRGTALPTDAQLAETEVLLLHDRPFPGGADGARLRRWIEGGGGLILAAGDRGGWPESAADLFPGRLGGVTDREGSRGERLVDLDYDHPVFEPFRGPRRGDFASARFYRARAYPVIPGDSARILARFDDGSVALAERPVGEGRTLVWASTLDAYWTDLALKPVFLPFVHALARHASGRVPTVEDFTAGQILEVTDAEAMETAGLGQVAEALAEEGTWVALTPSGDPRDLSAGAPFLSLDQAGFYLIRPAGQDRVRPVAVAVNVDRSEADPATLDPAQLAAAVGGRVDEALGADPGGGTASGAAPSRAQTLRLQQEDQERRQSLWRFLLVGALAFLALETVISNRLGARPGPRAPSQTPGGRHARATP